MTHLYTGDGKGKTSSAVGLAVRAYGQGLKVLFVQFLKGSPTGEIATFDALGIQVIRLSHPCGFWGSLGAGERKEIVDEHNAILRKVLWQLEKGRTPDLLVLDEFTYIYTTPMADRSLCDHVLSAARAQEVEIVLTGRDPGSLVSQADYISTISATRHPFARGVPARRGIEY
ncbi:MAG: cob(I)yrinic acid a,c-diamide adenosyltransferase [Kiritimatiellae bacterium]|nr:cob(I)yrinic acid a,c-diamide adenosyltransferase [Kiritimatiellia bacterium]